MEGGKTQQKEQSATVPAAEPFEDSATPTVATYDCPVCRKAHVLDLDRLQVCYPCHHGPIAASYFGSAQAAMGGALHEAGADRTVDLAT